MLAEGGQLLARTPSFLFFFLARARTTTTMTTLTCSPLLSCATRSPHNGRAFPARDCARRSRGSRGWPGEWIKEGRGRTRVRSSEPFFASSPISHRHCSLGWKKTNLAEGHALAASAGTAAPRRVTIVVELARRAAAAIFRTEREGGETKRNRRRRKKEQQK